MRVVGEIQHPTIKITLFHWNNKYLIKLETPFLEQTFKIPEHDLTSDEELREIIDGPFLNEVISRFEGMSKSLGESMARNQI